MTTHLASTLKGPVTQVRRWWPRAIEERMDEARTSPRNRRNRNEDAVPRVSDPDIRADLVLRVRREIAAGTYDTPDKWEMALDQLFDSLER